MFEFAGYLASTCLSLCTLGVYHPNQTLNDEFYISGESYTGICLAILQYIHNSQFNALIVAQYNMMKNNNNIMLICHKRVASNEAAVLQACHMSLMSDVHATSAVSIIPAS